MNYGPTLFKWFSQYSIYRPRWVQADWLTALITCCFIFIICYLFWSGLMPTHCVYELFGKSIHAGEGLEKVFWTTWTTAGCVVGAKWWNWLQTRLTWWVSYNQNKTDLNDVWLVLGQFLPPGYCAVCECTVVISGVNRTCMLYNKLYIYCPYKAKDTS